MSLSFQLQGHLSYGISLLLVKFPGSWFLPKRFKDTGDAVAACCRDYDLFEHSNMKDYLL